MQRLWLLIGSVMAVGAIGMGTFQVVGLLAHSERTEVETFAADGITNLRVDVENGPVDITGGDVDEITVVAEISRGLFATQHVATVDGETLLLTADCPAMPIWCEVRYTVTVPADLAVTVGLDDGRLTLRDLTGPITADGDNGLIELFRLGGEVRVQNDNGRIEGTGLRSATIDVDSDNGRIALAFADPPGFVTATSDNGRIEVVVPDTEGAFRVDARSSNGGTDVGVRTDPASDRSITATSDNGSVTVRYPSG